jgi:hypothetical protein
LVSSRINHRVKACPRFQAHVTLVVLQSQCPPGDDLDEWARANKVHVKEIPIRSRDRARMDDEDEDEHEASDDDPQASMPISSQNFEMSADTASNMYVIRAKI